MTGLGNMATGVVISSGHQRNLISHSTPYDPSSGTPAASVTIAPPPLPPVLPVASVVKSAVSMIAPTSAPPTTPVGIAAVTHSVPVSLTSETVKTLEGNPSQD